MSFKKSTVENERRERGKGPYIDTLSFLFPRKLTRLFSGTVVFQFSYA